MDEKKYHVKLKSPNGHKEIWWCGDEREWQPWGLDPVYGDEYDEFGSPIAIGWTVPQEIPSFTKQELSTIMGGAFYKPAIHDLYDAQTERMGFPEEINKAIVLVEDVKESKEEE